MLLVVLSIGAGWSAISSLSYRMDRMSAVNRLMDDISKMRLDRSAYLQSEGDAQAAKVLQDKIVEVGQHLVELQGFLPMPRMHGGLPRWRNTWPPTSGY